MKAVQFRFSLPRYGYTIAAGRLNPREYYGARSCVALVDVPEPELPGPEWVKLRSVLSGFCGSDLGVITLHDSPTTQPFASFPFTFGHENLSLIEQTGSSVEGFKTGERVTIIPSLGCEVRGIEQKCGPCSRGDTSICENFAEGRIAPGFNTGCCRDTGGGWSKYYVAHRSQLVRIPDELTDYQGALLDPLCSALHPVMRHSPRDGDHVLVVGAGVIGLSAIASLQALGIDCVITVVEPTEHHAKRALEIGADEVIDPYSQDLYEKTTEITRAKRYKPIMIEKELCMGGFDLIYDCVGSTATINDCLRLAASDGTVVLIGIQNVGRVDWTPVWMKGLHVHGNLGYGLVDFRGQQMHTFHAAIELIKDGLVDITDLVTHVFTIDEYKRAIEVNMCKPKYGAIKTLFDLSDL